MYLNKHTACTRACNLCVTAVVLLLKESKLTYLNAAIILLNIFFGSMVHLLTPEVKEVFADEAVIIVETTK